MVIRIFCIAIWEWEAYEPVIIALAIGSHLDMLPRKVNIGNNLHRRINRSYSDANCASHTCFFVSPSITAYKTNIQTVDIPAVLDWKAPVLSYYQNFRFEFPLANLIG